MPLIQSRIFSGACTATHRHRAPRFDAHLYSRAAQGGDGGDVHCLLSDSGEAGRIAIADVMGHGPCVARTGEWMHRTMVNALEHTDEGRVLSEVNELACARGRHAMTTAIVLGFDVLAGILNYANAGHLPVLFHRDDAMGWRVLWEVDGSTVSGIPLGARPDTRYFTRRVALRPGDRFLVVTDGVTEAPDAGDDHFGFDRLRAILQDHRHLDTPELVEVVVGALCGFTGGCLDHDDVTLLAVGIH